MAFTAAGYDNFVNNTMFTVLDAVKDMQPDMVRSIFMSVPWNPGQGDTVEFTSLTPPTFGKRVDENERYAESNPIEGDTLSKRQIQYGSKMNITRRMAKFNKHQDAVNYASAIVSMNKDILDLEMTQQVFGEADQTTFPPIGKPATNIATADTLALASASHTINGAGGTWTNLSTAGVPSDDNLTLALEAGGKNTVDDFGTNVTPNFNAVVIGNNPYMTRKFKQLLGSTLSPENSNNAVNVYDGAMKLIVLKHGHKNSAGVAKTNGEEYRWMIMDTDMARLSLQYQIAEEANVEPRFTDSDTLLASILCTQFAAFAAVRPQGMVFNLNTTKP